jgi:hypothetical protein
MVPRTSQLNSSVQRTCATRVQRGVYIVYISGCHRSVHRYTLLLEYGFKRYHVQYTRLCACHWNKAREDDCLSGKHLKVNLPLFQRGNYMCWTAKFLRCMNKSGLGPGSFVGLRSLDYEVLLATEFNEEMVEEALLLCYEDIFRTSDLDPRTAPSRMANFNQYRQWFIAKGRYDFMHRHLAEALPLHVHRKFMQFRLSCTDLRIYDHVNTRERSQRLCTLCREQIED